jgi:VWFA-related protein
MFRLLVPFLLTFIVIATAADDPVVFKSDVALSRVDAQVIDRDGRAITGLQADDFVLRMNGRVLPIRNFASEAMPIDILLLLDVSGSMQPHVRRIASAAHQALNVLAENDRVAIMVFDTSTRVRLPFRSSHSEVTGELDRLLASEHFSRGTRITRALLDAANYVRREARPEARRAIVILTDDQTQDEEDQERVDAALAAGYTVLSFLQAPYEQPSLITHGGRRGTWGRGGGWPGGGTGWPGGGGGGYPGGGGPVVWGPGGGYDRSHTAGTADIAEASGGDTMPVQHASALEDTLARLRQRYELHFYVPEGAKSVDLQSMQVDLSREARLRYQNAEVRSRRVYMSGGETGERPGTTVVTRAHTPADTSGDTSPGPTSTQSQDDTVPKHRRAAVNDSSGPRVNTIDAGGSSGPTLQTDTPVPAEPAHKGGWPRADQKSQDPN